MSANKTTATDASVEAYLQSRASAQQREDCDALIALFARVARAPATMWGPSIVGFGSYRYRYESGRTGESPLVGFAVRGRELVLYLVDALDGQQELTATLGPYKAGKSCIYIKQIADLDMAVLERMVATSVAEARRRHVPS